MNNDKADRIQNAIRHIQTAADVDPWAMEIAVEALERELKNSTDTISRADAIDAVIKRDANCGIDSAEVLRTLPPAQPEIIYCRDCKHFELDHFEKVDGFPIPIIVAHEICMKWGGGCRSSIDGWCFMAERRTDG